MLFHTQTFASMPGRTTGFDLANEACTQGFNTYSVFAVHRAHFRTHTHLCPSPTLVHLAAATGSILCASPGMGDFIHTEGVPIICLWTQLPHPGSEETRI